MSAQPETHDEGMAYIGYCPDCGWMLAIAAADYEWSEGDRAEFVANGYRVEHQHGSVWNKAVNDPARLHDHTEDCSWRLLPEYRAAYIAKRDAARALAHLEGMTE